MWFEVVTNNFTGECVSLQLGKYNHFDHYLYNVSSLLPLKIYLTCVYLTIIKVEFHKNVCFHIGWNDSSSGNQTFNANSKGIIRVLMYDQDFTCKIKVSSVQYV